VRLDEPTVLRVTISGTGRMPLRSWKRIVSAAYMPHTATCGSASAMKTLLDFTDSIICKSRIKLPGTEAWGIPAIVVSILVLVYLGGR
jgi:hypothetical protein